MEYKIWIDAIQQIPTADYVTNFRMLAESMHVRESADLEGLSAKDLRILAILLLNGLRDHPAGELLHQLSGKRISERFWPVNAATPLPRLKRLLSGAIDQVDDEDLWKQVKRFITRDFPPTSHHGGFVANSSEHRKYVNHLMREELDQIHVDIPHLLQTFFPSSVDGLKKRSRNFFMKCKRGRTPRYKDDTWTDWPTHAVEKNVFRWLKRFCKRLQKFDRRSRPDISHRRRLLGTRSEAIDEYSVMKQELNVGFVDASYRKHGSKDGEHPWPQILVPAGLNCNPVADKTGEAWHDLAMCAGKILLAQATRRFVVGFTICGTLMRVWVFDRLGGIASQQIDVNKEPVQFIEVMLGFLRMSEEGLGFDPTIKITDGEPCIEIERNGRSECIVIDGLIIRQCCMVGRATTCWKAHMKDHPETPLVIKDSWQSSERDEEGEMLKQATNRNVVNVVGTTTTKQSQLAA